jgi:diguanylate cyclase (GGDEF)-like protein/PAS domain S-box-containing protein
MRNALLAGVVTAAVGAGCGFLVLGLHGPLWLCLLAAAGVAALPCVVLLARQATIQLSTDAAEAGLADEQVRHQATREFIQRILEVIPMPVYIKDSGSRILFVNQSQAQQWGRSIEELVGVRSYDLTTDPAVVARVRIEDAAVLDGASVYYEEQKRHSGTGAEQFRVITKQRCLDAEGGYVIICAFFDTTNWRQAERKLQEALDRETLLRERTQDFVQRLIDVIPDPFFIKDPEGRFLMVNEALAREYSTSKEALIGVVSHVLASFPSLAEESRREDLAIIAGAEIDKEQHYILPQSGQERFRNVIKRRCTHIDGSPVIVAAHFNITRWKIAERELERIAHEDALTGLPNRRRFVDEAARMMSRTERHQERLSLLLFDLDHFKQVNDKFGHVVGDSVLKEVAQRMRICLRTEDLPCRWGGEEFVALLPLTSEAEALQVADRLRANIAAASLLIGGNRLNITVSCGIAEWRANEPLEHFLARADKALYEAKNAGRNTCLLASAA